MEGIIKSVQSYLENDRLVFCYTPIGNITLIAKGSQKLTSDLRILSQYLNLISFKEEKNKSMYILKESRLIDSFEGIKKDFFDVKLASIMFDLINKYVTNQDNHEKIYNELKQALLNFKKESIISFGFKILKYLGHPLNLKPDGRNITGFNLKAACLVYQNEIHTIDLNLENTLILLKVSYLTYDKIDKIDDNQFSTLKQFMYDYYEYHMDERINRK